MSEILGARDVTFRYARRGPKILDDVTISIDEGKKTAILGANGAGKSTLFGVLNALSDLNRERCRSRVRRCPTGTGASSECAPRVHTLPEPQRHDVQTLRGAGCGLRAVEHEAAEGHAPDSRSRHGGRRQESGREDQLPGLREDRIRYRPLITNFRFVLLNSNLRFKSIKNL